MTRGIKFPDDMDEKLKQLAAQKGLTFASLVKLACAEFIERETKKQGK